MAVSNYHENNLKVILNFLRAKGLNEYAVFGLVGNLYVESSLRADNLQNSYERSLGMSDTEYVAKVDSGEYTGFCTDKAGFGLCQWTSSGRKTGLLNYIKSKGLSIADINAQLEYLWIELTTAYKTSVLDVLYNAKSVDESARVVMLKFERPADQSETRQLGRVNYSLDFYNLYALNEEKNTVKICIDAGHGRNTAGKRCMKKIDPNETREWVLNDRIADKLSELLKPYNCELLRVDDVTGNTNVSLEDRVKKANNWGADVYISIHHNAGVNGGKGGGTVIFFTSSKAERKTQTQAQALYDAIVGLTKLVGNRSSKVINQNMYVCKYTKMPAFLIENGFMDSSTDVPIILSEDHANKTAQGILNFLVKEFKLQREAVTAPEVSNVIYRVQCGAFSKLSGAESLRDKLKADGYEAVIVSGTK